MLSPKTEPFVLLEDAKFVSRLETEHRYKMLGVAGGDKAEVEPLVQVPRRVDE